MFMNKRVDYRYWLMCVSRESPMIPIRSVYKMGWSSPVNLGYLSPQYVEVNYRGSKVAVKTYRYEVSFLVEVEADNIMIAEQSIAKDGIKRNSRSFALSENPKPTGILLGLFLF